MIKKTLRKITGIVLAAAMVIAMAGLVAHWPPAEATDPFAEMRDEYLQPDALWGQRPLTSDNLPLEHLDAEGTGGAAFLHLDDSRHPYESYKHFEYPQESMRTDRFIVRYREGRAESFEAKMNSYLDDSVDIVSCMSSFRTGEKIYRGETDSSDFGTNNADLDIGVRSGDTDRFAPEVQTVSLSARDMRVLFLREPMLPSEFAEKISGTGADRDILYVQPDFELSLLSELNLTVLGGDNTVATSPSQTGSAALEESATDGADPGAGIKPCQETGLDHGNGTQLESGYSETPENTLAEPKTDGGFEDEAHIDEDLEDTDGLEQIPSPVQQVTVAVIDTGVATCHELFSGFLHPETVEANTSSLSYAHGSHVTGILVKTVQETGADIDILPIRVFDNGNAHTSDIIAAIHFAEYHGARVINMSFGSTAFNRALYETIAESGALFVASAGNNRRDFDDMPTYPAGYADYGLPNVISVASVNADESFSFFSSHGSGRDRKSVV